MNVNELIQKLQTLTKEVRRRPIMESKPTVEDWLPQLGDISVEKVVTSPNGLCAKADPELTDEENIEKFETRYNIPMHIEFRTLMLSE